MTFTVTTREGARALPPGTVARSAAGTIAGRVDSWHGAVLGDERSFPWDRLELPLTVLWPQECPTCSWPHRETVNMVCQTCGTDYAARAILERAAPPKLDESRPVLRAALHDLSRTDDLQQVIDRALVEHHKDLRSTRRERVYRGEKALEAAIIAHLIEVIGE